MKSPTPEHFPHESNPESAERPRKKVLFIDDRADFLDIVSQTFGDDKDIVLKKCHSLEDARAAITETNPDVIFLDDNFGEQGGEGLIIAQEVLAKDPQKSIYSTTSRTFGTTIEKYAKLGVRHIRKEDLMGMISAVEDENSD